MRRCLGCFEDVREDLEVCPFCGYIEGTPPEESVHIVPGTDLVNRYTVGKVLGYGGFGVTYIGWDSVLEQKVAIKEFMPSGCSTRVPGQSKITVSEGAGKEYFEAGLERFIDEAKRLSKFQKEDGIVKVFDCIAENDTAYIIMEYLEGETLSEYFKKAKTIPESDALDLLMPVMKSLEVIHQSGIIHRDIAPDNIFITSDGQVKLIDFGAARYITADLSKSLMVIVKSGYSAEEQYRGNSDQGPHTDVYSMAATLYKVLTGETPPDVLERRERLETTNKDILQLPSKLNSSISPVVENALLNALNIRIEDRTPNMKEFISDLQSDEPVQRINGQIKKINLYRIPKWVKITVPICLSVIVVLAILIVTGVINFKSMFKTHVDVPEGYTLVPNVEGMSIEDAIETIEDSDLDYRTGGSVITDYVDADLIVYQDPEAEKVVEIDSIIEITVSRGNGEIILPEDGISTVPAFIWMEEDEAVEAFETAGLTVTVGYEYDENVTAGQIIRATDANGNEVCYGDEIPEGAVIIVWVSGDGAWYEENNIEFSYETLEYPIWCYATRNNQISEEVGFFESTGTHSVPEIVVSEPDEDGYVDYEITWTDDFLEYLVIPCTIDAYGGVTSAYLYNGTFLDYTLIDIYTGVVMDSKTDYDLRTVEINYMGNNYDISYRSVVTEDYINNLSSVINMDNWCINRELIMNRTLYVRAPAEYDGLSLFIVSPNGSDECILDNEPFEPHLFGTRYFEQIERSHFVRVSDLIDMSENAMESNFGVPTVDVSQSEYCVSNPLLVDRRDFLEGSFNYVVDYESSYPGYSVYVRQCEGNDVDILDYSSDHELIWGIGEETIDIRLCRFCSEDYNRGYDYQPVYLSEDSVPYYSERGSFVTSDLDASEILICDLLRQTPSGYNIFQLNSRYVVPIDNTYYLQIYGSEVLDSYLQYFDILVVDEQAEVNYVP